MRYSCKKYTIESPLRVFLSGQKYFGAEVLRVLLNHDKIKVIGVCSPFDDKYLTPLARLHNLKVVESGTLNSNNMPDGVDLGIAAHSFDYIGKKTRYKTNLGWLGYHPSLLPRHRGRSAIEWAIRMGDPVTGGTVFWLNSGIDRGDIFLRDWCFIRPDYILKPSKGASELWKNSLLPMGVSLFSEALNMIISGEFIKEKQLKEFSTFEPRLDKVSDIFRPDLELLPSGLKHSYITGGDGISERYIKEYG